jgi:hypothetical protein
VIAAALLSFLASGSEGGITATLRAEPAEVEVGQPMRWILEVEHPPGAAVRLPDVDPIPDDSWVLLEPRRVVRVPGGASETTRATWSVLSLEPGERALPAIAVQVEADGVARSIEPDAPAVAVRSALAAGEDAPRPIRGFHAAPGTGPGRRLAIAIGALVLLLAAALLVLRRRARRKPAAARAPTSLERLAELARSSTAAIAEDPAAGRAAIYALTRLLRESVDRRLGEDKAALVDVDWAALRESDERLPSGSRGSIARILREAEPVKYAQHAPTRFALEALLGDARNALEALEAESQPLGRAA